jgi:hypothetical protein
MKSWLKIIGEVLTFEFMFCVSKVLFIMFYYVLSYFYLKIAHLQGFKLVLDKTYTSSKSCVHLRSHCSARKSHFLFIVQLMVTLTHVSLQVQLMFWFTVVLEVRQISSFGAAPHNLSVNIYVVPVEYHNNKIIATKQKQFFINKRFFIFMSETPLLKNMKQTCSPVYWCMGGI